MGGRALHAGTGSGTRGREAAAAWRLCRLGPDCGGRAWVFRNQVPFLRRGLGVQQEMLAPYHHLLTTVPVRGVLMKPDVSRPGVSHAPEGFPGAVAAGCRDSPTVPAIGLT
ncbi:hypothetical protein GCM10018785_19170 [Streptomyces longispororuber]|uniref:Uncharacterized protein n=1 Tax=Streptomyces longispororuber TaxID=68230 RepID=A0A918ZGA9_9ACTN|nr:hypothetical protein GCM10018785_19170 [Streptomyces longispororuber]